MSGSSDGKVSHLEAMRSIAAQSSIRRRSDRLGAEGQVGRPLGSVGTIGSGTPLGDQGAIKKSQKHSNSTSSWIASQISNHRTVLSARGRNSASVPSIHLCSEDEFTN